MTTDNITNIPQQLKKKHSHYFKDVSNLTHIDVYRVCDLFNVTDPCLQHAVKKLLVAGGRGAGKNIQQDVQEAIDTLNRWIEMQNENEAKQQPPILTKQPNPLINQDKKLVL